MAITGLKLRCPLSACESMEVTAPSAGYTSGQMAKVNDIVGVIAEDKDSGETTVLIYKAPKILVPCPAAASGDYAAGEKVYFDAADAEVNQSSSGNTLCGIVLEAPTAGDEEVLISLDGMLGITS